MILSRAALALGITLLAAIGQGCLQAECEDNCPDERALVCGTDDRTYDNACRATCAGVDVQYAGPCTGTEETVARR